MSRSRRNPTVGSGSSLTRGARVTLRPLTEDDATMSAGRGSSLDRGRAGALPYEVVREADGAVIGRMHYRADDPVGWLSIGCIAVAEGERGWGYGSEAMRLLEAEAAQKWEAQRFRANVDARNGLGLYFWLRLGYRPATPGEVPGGASRGIITMVRTGRT